MAKAFISGGRICLETHFSQSDLCKSIPGGRWNKSKRHWHFAATPTTAALVEHRFKGELETEPEFEELLVQFGKIKAAEKFKTCDESELPPLPIFKTEPWVHQKRSFWFAYELPSTMLALDMGCGKSKVSVDLAANWASGQDGEQKILIVCPKSVIDVWPLQFETHSPLDYAILPLRKDSWSVSKKARMANDFIFKENHERKITIINYDSVWRSAFADFALSVDWDLIVTDESHRIKAPGSKVSLFHSHLGQRAKRKLTLTGTPLANGPLDAYGQYRFLDPGIYGSSFVGFRSRFALMGGFENKKVLGYQNESEFNRKFYLIAIRFKKEDVLDLPPATHVERFCDLNTQARRAYDSLKKIFVAELEAGEIVSVDNALVKRLRLQQITSGYVPSDSGKVMQVDTSKLDLFKDIIEDIPADEPLTVFCQYKYDLKVVKEALLEAKRTTAELSGSMNQLKEWQQGEFNSIVVQNQSGGVGIDLTRSCYQFFYSVGRFSDYLQSLARLDRPGQTRPVTVVHLVAKDTVDVVTHRGFIQKYDITEFMLNPKTGASYLDGIFSIPEGAVPADEEFVDRHYDLVDQEFWELIDIS